MSHEEIIGQLFYQDNRCGCDECLESSQKAMMKMALSKDRPSAYRVALAFSEYVGCCGSHVYEGWQLACHVHNEMDRNFERGECSGRCGHLNWTQLSAWRWAIAIDMYIDCGRVKGF